MKILVSGAAGYIGSVTVASLLEHGHVVIALDDLSRGHRQALPGSLPLEVVDILDLDGVSDVFRRHRPEAVMHFAGLTLVGESMTAPEAYFRNNVGGTINLLEVGLQHGLQRFVFSSSAAVYGEPRSIPIEEDHPLHPTNPYGESKRQVEEILRWAEVAHQLNWSALRYFNAAGATRELGEDHDPETHLIPIALQVALGQRPELTIFGSDYPTQDGTCVRDYVHVSDLAEAHVLALESDRSGVYNLGNGNGFSVLEVIEAVRSVTGHPVPARLGDRRAGDPPSLVASSDRARRELGWSPQRDDLRQIVEDAWKWASEHPDGYGPDAGRG